MMAAMTCSECGHMTRCPSCHGWMCEACGAPLVQGNPGVALSASAPWASEVLRLLTQALVVCREYEAKSASKAAREQAWRQRRILEEAAGIVRRHVGGWIR